MAKKYFIDKVLMKKRMILAMLLAGMVFIGLTIRLGYVMFVKESTYKSLASQQWTSDVRINAKRGRILDRNGNELAVSANVYRADLDLNTLRKDLENNKMTMEQVAADLSPIIGKEEADILHILTNPLPNGNPRGSAILKRRIEKDETDAIREFCKNNEINGIVISPDTKRYYPNGNFAAHVLGHTNSDGEGLTGLELYYNKYLSGVPGIKVAEIDQKSEGLPYTISEFTEPIDGRDVVTTIDENIQYFAEKLAQEALEDNEAKAVSIMVMDPNTGEILALANKPDYDPNNPWPEGMSDDDIQQMWRNRLVSDAYEPGSIFKVVTATAAIEKGVLKEGETFNCGGGLTIGGRNIHCWKTSGHGPQTFEEILKNSCNVGFMILGERLGAENLNEYIKKFGFGQKTGIDLPGESAGIVKATQDITATDLATISFGQSNTSTGVQYMRCFNAIANGGYLIAPHLMKEVTHYDDSNERVVDETYNIEKKQQFTPETMEEMRLHLEQVVSTGGGSKAKIDGYRIAGKTGTAQKVDTVNGGYAAGKYLASFAGMAPADNPKYTVYVSIDEPNPSLYYAGQIAAPVGQKLFNDLFNYSEMKPQGSYMEADESLKADVIVPEVRGLSVSDAKKVITDAGLTVRAEGSGGTITDINPKPGFTLKEGKEIILYAGGSKENTDTVIIPDLKGFTKESIIKLFNDLGLKSEFVGEGVVVEQSIAPEKEIKKGTTVTFHLGTLAD
ncbi:stage V sporulation protein D [Clostridium sp. UBA1056]|uniref:stage V sporulation protein D n=1 Tax=unclassified Clostridium TaxID=2614128 RepID=UPI003217F4A8